MLKNQWSIKNPDKYHKIGIIIIIIKIERM